MYDGSSDLLSVLMEETGGLGVDIVVDSGGKFFSKIILLTRQNMIRGAVHMVMSFVFFVLSTPARRGGVVRRDEAPSTQT